MWAIRANTPFAVKRPPPLAVSVPLAAAARNEVGFVPQESSAPFCETTEVEIWVDATDFQGGQMKFTYDSTCADITNWERNTNDFLYGTWESDMPGAPHQSASFRVGGIF